ncbi:MAG: flagellin [Steroidobacteraceae bacterium]
MSLVINTNTASLNAQRNLSKSQMGLSTAMERLSSGLRINKAADDAAGLAISSRMTTQINGLNQASRNANDGISLASTAEGALSELTANLQRIRELAVQAANSTNSSSDRAALDQEVQQRLQEIDRSAQQTAFNGQKVLDGSFGSATFQVGANVGETITIGLSTSMRTSAIGKTADYVGTAQYDSTKAVGAQGAGVVAATALASGDLTIAIGTGSAVSVGASADLSSGTGNAGRTAGSAYSKVQAINSASIPGLTATADTTVSFDFTSIATATETGYSLSINGQAVYSAYNAVSAGADLTGSAVAQAINTNAAATGVTASFDSVTNRMTLNAADGRNITLSQTSAVTVGAGFGATTGNNNTANDALTALTTATGTAVSNVYAGTIRLTANETITLGGAHETYVGYTDGQQMALGSSALNSSSVTSVANANTTITRVDSALSTVSALRSTLGAIQNRFQSAINSTDATAENLTAARSRIQDADFASESAKMTSANILQQAGVSVLAQANSSQQAILKLLQ